jgi:hypothetical protein
MSRSPVTSPAPRTWRDLPQHVAPRAKSPAARRRRAAGRLKVILAVVVVGGLGFGAYEVWRTMQTHPDLFDTAGQREPLRETTLETDGVLDLAWVQTALGLPEGVAMVDLDLFVLRDRLLASGQVSTAVLQRRFPDTLEVRLVERSPVMRLRARPADGRQRDYLLARDGVIFEGAGYDAALLRRLPWLGGVALARAGEGFAPLEGMERVAELLATAAGHIPRRYADWQVVSLERYASDGEIVVRLREGPEVIFGTREDFFSQVARLDLILDRTQARPGQTPRLINLAVGASQVPVALETAAVAVSPPSPRSQPRRPNT